VRLERWGPVNGAIAGKRRNWYPGSFVPLFRVALKALYADKIISASEGYPQPGHTLRNLEGRSLAILLYARGQIRTLFNTLQALILRLVGDVRNLEKDVLKVYVTKIHFFQYGC
jgi:hypothetical protein